MKLNDNKIRMGYDGGDAYWTGLRFNENNIPTGATITSAYITFVSENNENSAASYTFYGQDHDSSATFSSNNYDISSRVRTTASTSWPGAPAWVKDQKHSTPDLSAIVQEIVDRPGWNSGSPLTFLIEGTGTRPFRTWDEDPDLAPILSITFDTLPVGPTFSIDYLVSVERNDLSTGHVLTTTEVYPVSFSSAGNAVDMLNFGFTGQNVSCFGMADDQDDIWYINRFSGRSQFVTSFSRAPAIENLTYTQDRQNFWGVNGSRLGIIDKQDGTWTPSPFTVGSGNGEDGLQSFFDIDGLFSDPSTGILWATERNINNDYLLQIDPATGQVVKNAFGIGVDYLKIKGIGVLEDIDDIAVNQVNGIMYAINSSGPNSQLIQIDPATGLATVIGPKGTEQIEGFSITDYGDAYGTVGGGPMMNYLVSINLNTGALTPVARFNGGSDYEGCECRKGPPIFVAGLPVEYLYFEAKKEGNTATLDWATATETDNNYFAIERSADRVNFDEIGRVTGSGSGSFYDFTDENPLSGVSWYRLRQVDYNGEFSFSEIRQVVFDETAISNFTVYPSPAQENGTLNIRYQSLEGNSVTLELIDLQGRILRSKENTAEAGITAQTLELTDLAPGAYLLRLSTGMQHETRKIMISK